MTNIVIPLSDEQLRQLKVQAEASHLTPEEVARIAVEEWLSRSGDEFNRAASHVLKKNEELYKRLA
ncbi:MAG: DNA-binding protein [Gemmataceae bacterium]